MKIKPKNILMLFFLTSIMACVHLSERLKSDLAPYVGQHPDKIVEQWGAPDNTYAMESGVKVITYSSERQVSRSQNFGYSTYRFGNYSYTESCKINFYTDASAKKIERFTTNGEAGTCLEMVKDLKVQVEN